MTHWRIPHSRTATRDMVIWRRSVMIVCGFLIGGAAAVLVWGLS